MDTSRKVGIFLILLGLFLMMDYAFGIILTRNTESPLVILVFLAGLASGMLGFHLVTKK